MKRRVCDNGGREGENGGRDKGAAHALGNGNRETRCPPLALSRHLRMERSFSAHGTLSSFLATSLTVALLRRERMRWRMYSCWGGGGGRGEGGPRRK